MKEQNISQKPWIEMVPGGQLFVANLFGISVQAVSKWVKKRVPIERCPEIEKATNGAVTCEDLRPDVDWAFLRSTVKRKAA
jgi:DNA-binding transcriptional regulator YdaS (Cro superfamily)